MQSNMTGECRALAGNLLMPGRVQLPASGRHYRFNWRFSVASRVIGRSQCR